ncbi:alpha-pyrone synthesis polyketide synthase-like Pks11 [bacterium BMS3Abin10]|nr:alpha-pyrone synthesis polyketide synthase-like Pks11 [bacterium BMS3Abin10]GBE38151.1 alpha-pyrone synthesis polyketide synthase-like Pks11 [bacterium BMS3Bbin08]
MGCYGALPAIRMAHGFMASSFLGITPPKSRIDIVHTEILSAHGNLSNDSAEHIITMTLFSDGFIRYSVFSEAEAEKRQMKGLKILALKENLLSDSLDEMTWKLGPHTFDMTLSLKVPYAIRDNVKRFVVSLLNEAGMDFDREKENLAYAIHPGGPAIVKKICGELGLTEKQVELSDKVFYENGNLSSVTIPYIFREIIDSDDIPAGTAVLSLAFGPGLTISGMVLEKI